MHGAVVGHPVAAHGRAHDVLYRAGDRKLEVTLRVRHRSSGISMGDWR